MIFQKKQSDKNLQKEKEEERKEEINKKEAPEDFKKCEEDLLKVKKERDEYLAGWQRERADFSNFKKEQVKVFEDIQKFANLNFILEILPILDNFEMAIRHLPENLKNDEWANGIIQIREQFKNIFKSQEIEEIKTENEKFNPEFHEAIERVESEKEEGTIIEEVQKGYLMNGKILRPSRVKVAVKKPTDNKQ